MALRALSMLRTLHELPVVRIRLVTIHAFCKYQRLLEISARMALGTIDRGVFALKRVLGLRVIEALIDCLQRDFFPTARTVAGLATLRKASVVRILVAIGTQIKWNANILRLAVGAVDVALGALHLGMQAGQGISGLGMIEFADVNGLPVDEVVTREAIRSETSFVLIFVARDTTGRETEVGTAEILNLDGRAFLGRDARGIVALVAVQALVFAFEQIPSLFVIESLDIPLDQREVLSVVLGMATRTLLTRSGRNVVSCMKAFMSRKASRNFGMTLQTLQCRLAAKLVATGAVCGSVKRLVRSGELTRRDLSSGRRDPHQE